MDEDINSHGINTKSKMFLVNGYALAKFAWGPLVY